MKTRNLYQFENIDFFLLKFFSYLICLIPLALLTGSFFPDFFITLSSIFFFYISIKYREYYYFQTRFVYIFFLFYLFLCISSLLSDFPLHSLSSSFVYIRFGLFSLVIWLIIDYYPQFKKNFFLFFVFTFVYAAIDGIYQYFVGNSIFGFTTGFTYDSNESIRLALSFNDKAFIGGYLSRLLPLLIGILFLVNSKKTKKILLLVFTLIILAYFISFVSGERTAFATMIFMLIIVFLISKNHLKTKLLISLSFIIFIFSIISFDENISNRMIDKTMHQLGFSDKKDLDNQNNRLNFFSSHHEAHFMTALRMFKDHPIIGVGPNNFRNLCSERKYSNANHLSCSSHPHNIYIQVLSETGIIGFIFISSIFLYVLFKLYRETKVSKNIIYSSKFYFLLAFTITLLPILPSANFFNNWINIIYYLPLGFYLHEISSSEIKLNQ